MQQKLQLATPAFQSQSHSKEEEAVHKIPRAEGCVNQPDQEEVWLMEIYFELWIELGQAISNQVGTERDRIELERIKTKSLQARPALN